MKTLILFASIVMSNSVHAQSIECELIDNSNLQLGLSVAVEQLDAENYAATITNHQDDATELVYFVDNAMYEDYRLYTFGAFSSSMISLTLYSKDLMIEPTGEYDLSIAGEGEFFRSHGTMICQ